MKRQSTLETLAPAIDVIGDILLETSESFQKLLDEPEHHSTCLEAGRNLRFLSHLYTQVLLIAFKYTPEPLDDFDEELIEYEDNYPIIRHLRRERNHIDTDDLDYEDDEEEDNEDENNFD